MHETCSNFTGIPVVDLKAVVNCPETAFGEEETPVSKFLVTARWRFVSFFGQLARPSENMADPLILAPLSPS